MVEINQLIKKINKLNFERNYEFIKEEEATYEKENFLVNTVGGTFLVKKSYSTDSFDNLRNCVESKEKNCIELEEDFYFELNLLGNRKKFFLKFENAMLLILITRLTEKTILNVKLYRKKELT